MNAAQRLALMGTDTLVLGVTTLTGEDASSGSRPVAPAVATSLSGSTAGAAASAGPTYEGGAGAGAPACVQAPAATDPGPVRRDATPVEEPWLKDLGLSDDLLRRYRFGRQLGRGSVGVVLEATERATDRRVAVKLLYPASGCPKDGLEERFRREGRVLTSVRHPNVVEVVELGRSGERPFIVTERLEGGTLRGWLENAGRLPVQDALRVMLEVLDGLAECHHRGIVHRDIKPENILFDRRGRVRLVDFGLAKTYGEDPGITRAGAIMGTPLYMAPEQMRGEPAALATDVYACGAVLYELLSGRPPLTGAQLAGHLTGKCSALPQPLAQVAPDVPRAVAEVVTRAMSRSLCDRPSSAADLARRLRHAMGLTRKLACLPPSVPSRSPRRPLALRDHLGAALARASGRLRALGQALATPRLTRPVLLPRPAFASPSRLQTWAARARDAFAALSSHGQKAGASMV